MTLSNQALHRALIIWRWWHSLTALYVESTKRYTFPTCYTALCQNELISSAVGFLDVFVHLSEIKNLNLMYMGVHNLCHEARNLAQSHPVSTDHPWNVSAAWSIFFIFIFYILSHCWSVLQNKMTDLAILCKWGNSYQIHISLTVADSLRSHSVVGWCMSGHNPSLNSEALSVDLSQDCLEAHIFSKAWWLLCKSPTVPLWRGENFSQGQPPSSWWSGTTEATPW